jgi:hypothetical protein
MKSSRNGRRTEMLLKSTEFSWNKVGSFKNRNPYCIAFCYPSEGKPYVLKGGINTIETILKGTKIPVVVNQTYWKDKKFRSVMMTYGFPKSTYIQFWKHQHKTIPSKTVSRRYCKLIIRSKDKTVEYRMRRFPRCFPEQLREFIE